MSESSVERTTKIILELNKIALQYNAHVADKVASGIDDGYLTTFEDMWEAAESFYG